MFLLLSKTDAEGTGVAKDVVVHMLGMLSCTSELEPKE